MRTVQDGYESLDERLGISGEYPCTERGGRITESAVTPPQWRRARLPVLHRQLSDNPLWRGYKKQS